LAADAPIPAERFELRAANFEKPKDKGILLPFWIRPPRPRPNRKRKFVKSF
jgi:hypothetical protein